MISQHFILLFLVIMSNNEHSSDVWSVGETEAGPSDEYSSRIFVPPQRETPHDSAVRIFGCEQMLVVVGGSRRP